MRLLTLCLFSCAVLAVIAAGCLSQPATPPATTQPPATTPPAVTPSPTPSLQDPALYGVWYLKEMTGAGGANPVQTLNVPINIIFTDQNLSGFGGCNDYSATYTLTGQVLPNGKGIEIGPIATTLKYCADTSPTESSYLAVLSDATSYTVNVNQELSITDSVGAILVYQREPYGPLSVPKGL